MHRAVLALLLLLALPTAAATAAPGAYYLRDDELGGPGVLHSAPPNTTAPSARIVPAGTQGVAPVRFETPAGMEAAPRLRGLAYAIVWVAPSPSVDANLTARLLITNETAIREIGNASVPFVLDPDAFPSPEQLVPPNPTDPEGSVFHIVGQVAPHVLPRPRLFLFGHVDAAVESDARVAVQFELTNGSGGQPVPVAAFATLLYDHATPPLYVASFVYLPWHVPAPAPTIPAQPTPVPPAPGSSEPEVEPTMSPAGAAGVEEPAPARTPAPSVVLGLAALGAAVASRRRR
jgi:hypothetical protein